MRSCQVGDQAKQRRATFYARMHAIAGTRQMQMRFTLVDSSGDGPATAVSAPSLSQWRKSRDGVKTFGYTQRIKNLATGGRYSAQVQFRWLDARGRVIKTAKRTSGECRQQGSLPNLTVSRLAIRPTATAGTFDYSVDVTNAGKGEARGVVVDLFIDNAAADAVQLDLVAPGETARVHITGPACERAVRFAIDRSHTVSETNDDDNVLRARCPVAGS